MNNPLYIIYKEIVPENILPVSFQDIADICGIFVKR
jgi:hypothetical protein